MQWLHVLLNSPQHLQSLQRQQHPQKRHLRLKSLPKLPQSLPRHLQKLKNLLQSLKKR